MAGQPLPPTVYILSDSGEKCFVVLFYFGTLVELNHTHEVFYNQLLVDHTHEDVDGQFGVGSQHLNDKNGGFVLTPLQFFATMRKAFPNNMTWTHIRSILDWETFFGSNKAGTVTEHRRINDTITGIRTQRFPLPGGDTGSSSSEKCDKGIKRSPKAFWLHKHEGKVVLHYKEYDCDPIWLPYLRDTHGNVVEPRCTDPAGIPFPTTPADALGGDFSRLVELELFSADARAKAAAVAGTTSKDKRQASRDGSELMLDDGDDGGDDSGHNGGNGASESQKAAPKRAPYDPNRCVAAVKELSTSTANLVEINLSFITPEVLAEWRAWADAEPTTLAAIPTGERTSPTVLALPECSGAPNTVEITRAQQVELMTWKDHEDASRGLTVTRKQQEALESRSIQMVEIKIGQTCLVARTFECEEGEVEQLFPTPFWLGDVVAKDDATSTIALHWRAPFVNGAASGDVNGAWNLLCRNVSRDTIHGLKPKQLQCKHRGHEPWLDANVKLGAIVMHNVGLKADGRVDKRSMKLIVALSAQLGVPLTFTGEKIAMRS